MYEIITKPLELFLNKNILQPDKGHREDKLWVLMNKKSSQKVIKVKKN